MLCFFSSLVGKPKPTCMSACRKAVKEMDHTLLVKALLSGQ